MPKPISHIHDRENLSSTKACRDVFYFRKLIILSLYYTNQIFRIKLSIFLWDCDNGAYLLGRGVTGAMTLCASRPSNATLSLGLSAIATRRGACCTGGTVSSNLILYSPSSCPSPSPKTSGNYPFSSSLVIGEHWSSTA